MSDQSPDTRGEAAAPRFARPPRGRHAIPRTSALTRLRLPVGRALALTALPTALILGSQRLPDSADTSATAALSVSEEGQARLEPAVSTAPVPTTPQPLRRTLPQTPPRPLIPARPALTRAGSPSSRRRTRTTRERARPQHRPPLPPPRPAQPPRQRALRTSSVPSSATTPSSKARHPTRAPHSTRALHQAWQLRGQSSEHRPSPGCPPRLYHLLPATGPSSRRPDRSRPKELPAPATSATSRPPRNMRPADSPPRHGT